MPSVRRRQFPPPLFTLSMMMRSLRYHPSSCIAMAYRNGSNSQLPRGRRCVKSWTRKPVWVASFAGIVASIRLDGVLVRQVRDRVVENHPQHAVVPQHALHLAASIEHQIVTIFLPGRLEADPDRLAVRVVDASRCPVGGDVTMTSDCGGSLRVSAAPSPADRVACLGSMVPSVHTMRAADAQSLYSRRCLWPGTRRTRSGRHHCRRLASGSGGNAGTPRASAIAGGGAFATANGHGPASCTMRAPRYRSRRGA